MEKCVVCGSHEVTMTAGDANGPQDAYCDDHGPDWMGYDAFEGEFL